MRKEDLKNWTLEMMQNEIIRLDRENTDLQNSHLNLYNTTKDEMRRLKTENEALKQKLQNMTGVCDGRRFSDYENLPFGDDEDEKDRLIAELQDRHQQDCIRINDLATTVHVLAGLYSALRKNVGMD